LKEHAPAADADPAAKHRAGEDRPAERRPRVEPRAERLDRRPPLPAALDRPCVIERLDELRALVSAPADRLTSYARRA
jgi:hypothetical protein